MCNRSSDSNAQYYPVIIEEYLRESNLQELLSRITVPMFSNREYVHPIDTSEGRSIHHSSCHSDYFAWLMYSWSCRVVRRRTFAHHCYYPKAHSHGFPGLEDEVSLRYSFPVISYSQTPRNCNKRRMASSYPESSWKWLRYQRIRLIHLFFEWSRRQPSVTVLSCGKSSHSLYSFAKPINENDWTPQKQWQPICSDWSAGSCRMTKLW